MDKQKTNYQRVLDNTLKNIQLSISQGNPKPQLLLHACCGPCSSYVLEYIAKYFDITILYYNPNIYPETEYNRRLQELKDLLTKFPPALLNNVKLIEDEYNPNDFYSAIRIKQEPEIAHEKEKGKRCKRCYHLRLRRAFEYAFMHNFQYFCTTLSISPFKDEDKINYIGSKLLEESPGPIFLTSDFKKKGGFQRSLEISKEYNLYRQQYCGCVYSKINSEKEREELKLKAQ